MPADPEFLKRIHLYKIPPATFDPLEATEPQLEQYRLPARPSPDQPEALAFWGMLFSSPLQFIEAEFEYILPPRPMLPAALVELDDVEPAPRTRFSNGRRFETSRNWSGAYLRAPPSRRFSSVHGAWVVPDVHVPVVAPMNPWPNDADRDQYRSSIWLGLDGYRSYPRVTMPQLGTWQRLKQTGSGPVTDFAAWWQWWSHDEVTPVVKFANLPVGAGDKMLAGLVLVSSDEVVFYVKNQTTGHFAWVLVQAPPRSEPLGATAEWIVERPTEPRQLWPWRLPRLDDVAIEHCHALAGPALFRPQTLHDLERARFIRMQERFPAPYRSAFISVPERLDASRVAIRYREG